jgi:hypothetical protein
MLGHVSVAERAISNLVGHIQMTGLRLDLAQLALGTEAVAHSLMAYGVAASRPLFPILLRTSPPCLGVFLWPVSAAQSSCHAVLRFCSLRIGVSFVDDL